MYSDVSGNDAVSITVSQNTIALNRNQQQQAIIFGNKALKLACAQEVTVNSYSDLGQYLIDEETDARQQLIDTVKGWFSQGNRSVKLCDIGNVTADTIDNLDQYCYIGIAGYNWTNIGGSTTNILYNTATQLLASSSSACYIVGSLSTDEYTSNNQSKLKGYKSLFTIANSGITSNNQVAAGAVGYELSNYNPSSFNKVNPMTYRYLYSTTPMGDDTERLNKSLIDNYNTNLLVAPPINTTNAKSLLFPGILSDGNDFTYWYGIDYIRFYLIDQVTNLLITASNSSINPIYYDQTGINRIKDAVTNAMSNCASYGIIQNNYTITATDFSTYVQANPSDYKSGLYGGIMIDVMPLKSLKHIKFYLNINDFIS